MAIFIQFPVISFVLGQNVLQRNVLSDTGVWSFIWKYD
jgi:hypothetical protein